MESKLKNKQAELDSEKEQQKKSTSGHWAERNPGRCGVRCCWFWGPMGRRCAAAICCVGQLKINTLVIIGACLKSILMADGTCFPENRANMQVGQASGSTGSDTIG